MTNFLKSLLTSKSSGLGHNDIWVCDRLGPRFKIPHRVGHAACKGVAHPIFVLELAGVADVVAATGRRGVGQEQLGVIGIVAMLVQAAGAPHN